MIQPTHVMPDDIYQRIVQHVVNVHVDIIVNDEHGVRVLMISERKNVEPENGQLHEQQVLVAVEK